MQLQSRLFSKTRKDIAEEETSVNAKLLIRGGFIDKTMAGVYTLLPLGFKVVEKIKAIVRDEMNAADGQELLMPALQPQENWEATGRWEGLDVLFKVPSATGGEYELGPTHEEIVTPLAKKIIASYRDLPTYVYQIQTKFRNEPRAKSGILRGREFIMKDLYSFHTTPEDLDRYYEIMRGAYGRVFERVGVNALEVRASGGTFSKFSHEYQVPTESGEDLVFWCVCGFAENKEIAEVKEGDMCPSCKEKPVQASKAIEVGNIFKLNTKYSTPFSFTYKDQDGTEKDVYMGCYGIGITRLLGTIVEVHNDEHGIVWPASVAPYDVHVVALGERTEDIENTIAEIVTLCGAHGKEVLVDDRGLSAGASLTDSDLLGIPLRVVVSKKSLAAGGVEVKLRHEKDSAVVSLGELGEKL